MNRLGIVAVLALTAVSVHAQGIRGVTRRTSTQEFQAPARQFFDAAGINVTGGAIGGAAGVSGPSSSATARPVPAPLLSGTTTPGSAGVRPYVLVPANPAAVRVTNAIVARRALPPKSAMPLRSVPVPVGTPAAATSTLPRPADAPLK